MFPCYFKRLMPPKTRFCGPRLTEFRTAPAHALREQRQEGKAESE
jgi:hypothetical protein